MSSETSKKYSKASKFYDIFEWPMEQLLFKKLRKNAVGLAEGNVLEVGIGTGKNLPYYHRDTLDLTAIDFSSGMLDIAEEKKNHMGWNELNLYRMDIENMRFDDESFDTIVSTFVFCTVPDPQKGLQELYRVLKRGGKVIFLEHMKSRYAILNNFLKIMNFFSSRLLGTSMLRETQKNIQECGFVISSVEYTLFDIVRLIIAHKE